MLPRTGPHLPVLHVARDAKTVGDMFRRRAQRSRTRIAVYEKRGDAWMPTTWGELYDAAGRVAAGLRARGVAPGDRVAIVGATRSAWGIYDMGAQLAGCVSFGIYPKQTPEQIRYLLEHSEAKAVFVEDEELDAVVAGAAGLDALSTIAPWTTTGYARKKDDDPRIVSPAVFERDAIDEADIERIQDDLDPDETAILVYTSGTTGPPKGAMITHRNVLTIMRDQGELFDLFEDDLSFNFLPMAHVAERVLGFYGRVNSGITTAYPSSIATVLDEVKEAAPTLFGSVPRLFEKAYATIVARVDRGPAAARRLFAWADGVARRAAPHRMARNPMPGRLKVEHAIADRLVFSKVRAAFGGQVRHFVVGAAPIAPDLLEFFWGAGLNVYEMYGMTEATVVTHANRPGAVKVGTVGRPLSIVEQRIADDGEVLLRGPLVFKGYYKNPEATAEAIRDGWLHTGDVGSIDDEGYLHVTDRKKHLIITAGGKNLAPANIENAIKQQSPLVSQVHAHGDKRPYVSALLAPSPIETLELGVSLGLVSDTDLRERTRELMENPAGRTAALESALSPVVRHPDFVERMKVAVRAANAQLANVERVRRFAILDRDFSQEHGELTPTMKLRRKAVEQSYADLFDRIYDDPDFALEP